MQTEFNNNNNNNNNVNLKASRDPKHYLKSAKNYKAAMQQSVSFTVPSFIPQQLATHKHLSSHKKI
jgi:hypothetical protein